MKLYIYIINIITNYKLLIFTNYRYLRRYLLLLRVPPEGNMVKVHVQKIMHTCVLVCIYNWSSTCTLHHVMYNYAFKSPVQCSLFPFFVVFFVIPFVLLPLSIHALDHITCSAVILQLQETLSHL